MRLKMLGLFVILITICIFGEGAYADCNEQKIAWILDTWEETIENGRYEGEYPIGVAKKTIWITGFIQIPSDLYTSRKITVVCDDLEDGIVLNPNFYIHTAGNSGFSTDHFTSDGDLFIRCGIQMTIHSTDDPCQKITQFFTICNPKLIVYDPKIELSYEIDPICRVTQDGRSYERSAKEMKYSDFAQMSRRIQYDEISIKIQRIAEITDNDIFTSYEDYHWASFPLTQGYRCWQISFQLISSSDCDNQIKTVMPFSKVYDWDLFAYEIDKPFFFLGDFQYASVDENGCFVAYMFTNGKDVTLGSVFDILNDCGLTFVLSCEPLMYGCSPRTRADLWSAFCVYSEE